MSKQPTDEEFDEILQELVEEEPAGILLGIPGVYDLVKEEYNNAVLTRWQNMQTDEEEE